MNPPMPHPASLQSRALDDASGEDLAAALAGLAAPGPSALPLTVPPPEEPEASEPLLPAELQKKAVSCLLDPAFQAYSAIAACRSPERHGIDPDEVLAELQSLADRAASGDHAHSGAIAMTQATALNVIFGRLTELAMHRVGDPNFDSMMRLALRAQSQCVHTLQSLTKFNNRSSGPGASIIAHQLNVANQQVVHSPST